MNQTTQQQPTKTPLRNSRTSLIRAATAVTFIVIALLITQSQASAQGTPPTAPLNLTAVPIDATTINLDWDAPTTANGTLSGYRIEKNDGSTWELLEDTSTNIANQLIPKWQDSTVPENGTRSYRVKAINEHGTGPASNEVTATAVNPPMLLLEARVQPASIALEFNTFIDPTSRPPKSVYTVKVNGIVKPIKKVFYPATEFQIIMGLEPVTHFRAGEVITVSYSKPSSNPLKDALGIEADSFTDFAAINDIPSSKPTAPRNLDSSPGNSLGTYDLNWDAAWHNGSPILRYEIRVDSGSWITVTGADAARSHTLTGLQDGAKYRFQVRAVNGLGIGPEASVFVPKNPVTFNMYGINYSITRGSNVKGDRKAPLFLYANASVSTNTTFLLTWNGRPTDELHPDNPTQLTIKAGDCCVRTSLRAAPDDDNPKVYNQPVKANVVATLGDVVLSAQLVVFDDEWLPTASFRMPDTVEEGQTFRISATLSHRLDVDTYVIGTVANQSKMSLQGFKQPYIYIYIPVGELSGESGDISKPDDDDEDGYGDLYISVNNSDLIHWWPEDQTHTVRVTDDDTENPALRRYHGEPRIFSGDGSATESGDPNTVVKMPFTVVMYPTSRATVTVDYRTADGSAKAGVNYRSTSGTLTFAPREGTKTLYVDVLDDGIGKYTSFRLFLENPTGAGAEAAPNPYTGRIYDQTPTLLVWDQSARESGNQRETDMTFSVALSPRSPSSTVTVDYTTADGTARAGSDYTAVSGTLEFAPGDRPKQVNVPIIDDTIEDSGETFSFVLSNPTGGAQLHAWRSTATGTILNEDAPGVSANLPASRFSSASHRRTDDRPQVIVEFSEAVANFAAITPSVEVTDATVTSAQTHTEDGLDNAYIFFLDPDGNNDVSFTLISNTPCDSGGICTASGTPLMEVPPTLTIPGPNSEDTTPDSQLSITDASASEEDDSTIDFVVTLNPASEESVTVDYATSNGSATAGDDYTAKSGSLAFTAGQTSKTIQVSIIDDTIDDDNETFTLTLSSPYGAQISDATGTGTISNSEPVQDPPVEDPPAQDPVVPLTASFANVPADHNGGNFTFDLTFSENVDAGYARIRDHAFTITGATIDSASRTTQGSNQGWTIEVNPTGNGSVTITLPETTDCDDTGAICTDDGSMLSHSTSATVAGPPAVSVSDANVQEAEGAVLVFTVTLSHASSRTVTVDYATQGGTATAGSDYTAASGKLTFNAGDTSQTVQVTVLTDQEDESEETLTLTLSNPSQATLDDATATGAIENGESSSGTQEDPPADTPVVSLTATFANMPATHQGTTFTFDLSFSENVKAGYARIRDDALTISGGKITNAQRKEQGSNQNWTITVKPDGNGAITITLPETTDCDATGAICTDDERKLSNSTPASIAGPQ